MIKTFWDQSIAAQYIIDNKLPMGSIRLGERGYNRVEDGRVGGVVTAPSHTSCRSSINV